MTNKIVKILHYIPGFNYGGIEQRFVSWHDKLDKENFQFDLLVNKGSDSSLLKALVNEGVIVHEIPSINPRSLCSHKAAIKKLFNDNIYDAIHCHSPDKSFYVLKYAKTFNIKVRILQARTSKIDKGRGYYLKMFFKKNSPKFATHKLAVSKVAGEWLFGKKNGFNILNNAIELEAYKYNTYTRTELRRDLNIEDKLVLGHAGRFTHAKNHQFIIKIFNELVKKNSKVLLLLVGDGPLMPDIKEMVEKFGLTDKVIMIGFTDEISKYYQAMDFFLFPSHYEGLPGSLIEAQASGLNCLISNTISNEAIVNKNVKVCGLENEIEFWIKNIIFSNPSEREINEDNFISKGYDLKRVVKELENIYRK